MWRFRDQRRSADRGGPSVSKTALAGRISTLSHRPSLLQRSSHCLIGGDRSPLEPQSGPQIRGRARRPVPVGPLVALSSPCRSPLSLMGYANALHSLAGVPTGTGSTRNRWRGSARCRRAIPMSPSAGNGPERRYCSSWLCRAVRTSIKVTSRVWRRSRTCPRKSRGPDLERSATLCAGGTAAGCRFRGRARSRRSDSGRSSTAMAAAACRLGRADRRSAGRQPGQHAEPVSGCTG